jgi:hypothetical protein
MKQIQKTIILISIFLLFVKGISLYGQNDINFSFECRQEINKPFKSGILLKFPNKKTYNLYSDTTKRYYFSDDHFLKLEGKYTLSIWFEAGKYIRDSVDYNFKLNGNEINTSISVDFDYREEFCKKGDIYEKGRKILNGHYLAINRIDNSQFENNWFVS